MSFEFDEIGPWSEMKLDILGEYAGPYSRILTRHGFHHGYIDAFSGPGFHIRRKDKQEVPGSPLVALGIEPRFDEYHFIDLDGEKMDFLRTHVGTLRDAHFYTGDSNRILSNTVLPRFSYDRRTRALCLLDPYKLTLDWDVLLQAGKSHAVEVFVNFPVMHMNRNCKKEQIADILPGELSAMDRFWGDRSWHESMFRQSDQMGLFGDAEFVKQENRDLVNSYCRRLQEIAHFGFVAEPFPMRNSKGAIVYYLIFASPNQTGWKIVQDIYRKYRWHGL